MNFVVVRIDLIPREAKFVKDSISVFGPFVNKCFGRVTKNFQSFIVICEEMEGNADVVSGLAASATLLGERAFPMNGVVDPNVNINTPIN